LIFKIN